MSTVYTYPFGSAAYARRPSGVTTTACGNEPFGSAVDGPTSGRGAPTAASSDRGLRAVPPAAFTWMGPGSSQGGIRNVRTPVRAPGAGATGTPPTSTSTDSDAASNPDPTTVTSVPGAPPGGLKNRTRGPPTVPICTPVNVPLP